MDEDTDRARVNQSWSILRSIQLVVHCSCVCSSWTWNWNNWPGCIPAEARADMFERAKVAFSLKQLWHNFEQLWPARTTPSETQLGNGPASSPLIHAD
jgi:hypothetical protein